MSAVTGGLIVGGTAVSGSAAAHEGGVALFNDPNGILANEVFTIFQEEVTEDLEPTCLANKEYTAYRARYLDDNGDQIEARRLWVEPNRNITIDPDPEEPGALHEWRNVRECKDESTTAVNLTNRGNMVKVNPGRGNGPP